MKTENFFCKKGNKGVSLLLKSKKDYFAKLNKKNITDNRQAFLVKKTQYSERINLTEEH